MLSVSFGRLKFGLCSRGIGATLASNLLHACRCLDSASCSQHLTPLSFFLCSGEERIRRASQIWILYMREQHAIACLAKRRTAGRLHGTTGEGTDHLIFPALLSPTSAMVSNLTHSTKRQSLCSVLPAFERLINRVEPWIVTSRAQRSSS